MAQYVKKLQKYGPASLGIIISKMERTILGIKSNKVKITLEGSKMIIESIDMGVEDN